MVRLTTCTSNFPRRCDGLIYRALRMDIGIADDGLAPLQLIVDVWDPRKDSTTSPPEYPQSLTNGHVRGVE